jgi:hypothetical protein
MNIYETFTEFINSLQPGDTLNEAFGSKILASVLTKQGNNNNKELANTFYSTTKIALDKVQDEDIIVTTPAVAYKQKSPNTIMFYVSDKEKPNKYANDNSFREFGVIPGGGYLLAIASGENIFYVDSWRRSGKRTLELKDKSRGRDANGIDVGISKQNAGWNGTGLINVKRIAEVADRAIILDINLLQQKYSTDSKRNDRYIAQGGAIAFVSDEDFKEENMSRYSEILSSKAMSLPLDKMVLKAIDELAEQMKDGVTSGNKTKFGEILIGVAPNGREVKVGDASYLMRGILDDYASYVRYSADTADAIARFGEAPAFYAREVKSFAKQTVDKIKQIKSFSYA